MAQLVKEARIGDVRWLVASGERRAVFRALGEHAGKQISSLVEGLPELSVLRKRVQHGKGEHFREVAAASRRGYPTECDEIEALAEGADVNPADLVLLALRGDLGLQEEDDCSDLAWTDGHRALLGHNEDGDIGLHGMCSLLTLRLDGEPAVVTWWYPGFLPGNTFTINEYGLVWGVDAIRTRRPLVAPGRAFVARGLQRVQSLDAIVVYLRRHPAAGAFTYVVGALGSPRLLSVEQVGDQVAYSEPTGGPTCVWHTNHLRYLPAELNAASSDTLARGAVLSGIVVPPENPTADWMLEVLIGSPLPDGVRAEGSVLTLCTLVADLELGTLTVAQRGSKAVSLRMVDLIHGELGDPEERAVFTNRLTSRGL